MGQDFLHWQTYLSWTYSLSPTHDRGCQALQLCLAIGNLIFLSMIEVLHYKSCIVGHIFGPFWRSLHTHARVSSFAHRFPFAHVTHWILEHHRRVKRKEGFPNVQPCHCYIHAILARCIGGRLDSLGVVSRSDLLIVYSIFKRYLFYLEHLFADVLSHQW